MRIVFLMMVFLVMRGGLLSVEAGDSEQAWKDLNSEDASVRAAARVMIESRPIGEWLDRALNERRTWAALEIIKAVRDKLPVTDGRRIKPHLCEMITTLPLEQMSEDQLLITVELTKTIFERLGKPSVDEQRQMVDLWKAIGQGKSVPDKARVQIGQLLEWLNKQDAL